MTLHDLIAGALDRRLPPSPSLRAALQAALRQAQAEGYTDEEEAAARAAATLAHNPQVRREVAQREAVALSVEYGLQLGATYDAEQDTWTPPMGMTVEVFLTVISERLQAEASAQWVTALTLGVGYLQRAAQLRRVDRPLTAVLAALATADDALLAAVALAETTTEPLPVPVSWDALAGERLVLPWSAFRIAHPIEAARLEDQLAAAQAAAAAMRQATAADAPLAVVLPALQQCRVALAGVRELVAG
jgi:hypothetical protein